MNNMGLSMFWLGIIQIILLLFVLTIITAFVGFGTMGDPQRAEEIMDPIIKWALLIGLGPWLFYYGAKFIRGIFSAGKLVSEIRSEGAIEQGSLKRTDNLSNTDFASEVLGKVLMMAEKKGIEVDFSDLLEAKKQGLHAFSVGVHTEPFDIYEKSTGERFAIAFTMPSKRKGACTVDTVWHPDGYEDLLNSYKSGSTDELADWLFNELIGWNAEIQDKVDAEFSKIDKLRMLSGLEIPG